MMKARLALMLILFLPACASPATGTPVVQQVTVEVPMQATVLVIVTSPPVEIVLPTSISVPTNAAIRPPSSGGAVTVPTKVAPTPASVTSGRGAAGWARIDAANPPPARYDHTLTLDPASSKLVLFGGRDGSKTLGDTWIFDLKTNVWREVKTSPAPGARFGHAAAYDARSKHVLIFAGQASEFFNDVWAFDAAQETWQKMETKGTPPAARYGTSAVVDVKVNQLIVTHGFASTRFDDTFALDLSTLTWSQIQGVDGRPLKRCLHESVYDAKSDRMILFGGCSSGFGPCPQGDLWSLDVNGKDWNEISPKGIKPSPRSNPALVGDDAGRLILFGGLTSDGPSADVWSLDVASGEWTDLAPGNNPMPRSSHDAVWNPAAGQLIVFGGKGSGGALNDMWTFSHGTSSSP